MMAKWVAETPITLEDNIHICEMHIRRFQRENPASPRLSHYKEKLTELKKKLEERNAKETKEEREAREAENATWMARVARSAIGRSVERSLRKMDAERKAKEAKN